MKVALIGYGFMGRLVGQLALAKGHEVALTIDLAQADCAVGELAGLLQGCDVAIDFSITEAVPKNAEACARAGVPLVVGTTGWQDKVEQVRSLVEQHHGALIYGANFSVGMQVFYRIAARAAELFGELDFYDPFIEEAHHKRKRDVSGTAVQLRQIVGKKLSREVPLTSTRAGYIPGTHRLGFDSV